MGRKRWVGWSAVLVLVGLGVLAACVGSPKPEGSSEDETSSIAEALTSSANLLLQEETASCVANQALDFLKVTNNGTAAVKVSDISIKLWVDDTTAQNIVGMINYGGCVTSAAGVCTHPVTGVTVSATHFTPACGTDPTHQADWELKISSTDTTTLAAGSSWANIQSTIHLANFANFSPGTADWYSPCVSGSTFVADGHFAVYVAGNLVSASPGVPPSCRATTGNTVLTGEVPPGLGTTYTLVGPLPGTTQVTLAIGLPLNAAPVGQPPLTTFIQGVSTPSSPTYQHYLSSAAFASTYGANPSDYAALQSFATLNGLKVTETYASRALLGVTGTAAAIENAFFVTLNVYRRPDGTTFYAPANQPSFTLALTNGVLHISGFDTLSVASPSSGIGTSIKNCGTGSGIYGADVRNIYLGQGATAGATTCANGNFGAGQTIGLLELDSYVASNVTTYVQGGNGLLSAGGITNANPTANFSGLAITPPIGVGGATATAFAFGSPPAVTSNVFEGEVELGMEMVIAMAPQAKVVVYVDTGDAVPNDLVLARMADPLPGAVPPPQVLANTWTWTGNGTPDAIVQQTLEQFAAQGQTFLQASGDFGSYITAGAVQNVPEPIIESPLMTVVGGTSFNGGTTEAAWNNLTERGPSGCTSSLPLSTTEMNLGVCNSVSGGGLCSTYLTIPKLPIPNYQLNVASLDTTNVTPSTTRMIPDVSMVADDIAAFSAGQAVCAHGTSASAALWAGYIAVANSLAAINDASTTTALDGIVNPATGFANPLLYSLASQFHDITSGNNNYTGASPTTYGAVGSYDLVTGLGTPTPSSNSCSLVTKLPTQACMAGTAVSALVIGNSVTAVMPVGSYDEPLPGIDVIPLEAPSTGIVNGFPAYAGTVAPAKPVPTAATDFINTCAGNSQNGVVVCTANNNMVYYFTLASVLAQATPMQPASLTDGANTAFQEIFSGGVCSSCNVSIDPVHDIAYVSIATPASDGITTAAAYQPYSLDAVPGGFPPTKLPTIQTGTEATTEDVVIDPFRSLVLSPNEGSLAVAGPVGDYQLINPASGAIFNSDATMFVNAANEPLAGTVLDGAAEDCSTGMALSTLEFANEFVLVDLNNATFSAAAGTWHAPFTFVPVNEIGSTGDEFGAPGAAVVEASSHLAVLTSEFGANGFAVIQLPTNPSLPGAGPPALPAYVVAQMPTDPDGNPWEFGLDPHTVTAYQSPNDHKAYGVFEDDVNLDGTRTYLAIVDLQGVMGLTRVSGNSVGVVPSCSAATGAVNTSTGGNPAGCIIRFVKTHP
jgi:Pro-kumamolisin, activation domain